MVGDHPHDLVELEIVDDGCERAATDTPVRTLNHELRACREEREASLERGSPHVRRTVAG